MSTLDKLKLTTLRALRPVSLSVRKNAPEILMVAGTASVVGSGILLVRQTLRVEPILEEHRENLAGAKAALDQSPDYSDEEVRKDVARVYVGTGLKLAKHYGPAISLGAAGVTSLLAANNILKKRNVALLGAFKALETSFGEYRKRVAEHVGEEVERDIFRGFREEEVVDPDTGKKKKVTSVDPNGFSIYSKFFDEYSPYWSKTPEYNLIFLKQKQAYFNNYLHARGYVFLNEVYSELGIEKTQTGNVVGWSLQKDGDGFIDFGIYDFDSDKARAFVNGLEASIRLDFNVDGPILDTIPVS